MYTYMYVCTHTLSTGVILEVESLLMEIVLISFFVYMCDSQRACIQLSPAHMSGV